MGKKRTIYTKTTACLFMFYLLLTKRRVKKDYLEDLLEVDSRTTVYNYYKTIDRMIVNLDYKMDDTLEIYYDDRTREYVLAIRRKK